MLNFELKIERQIFKIGMRKLKAQASQLPDHFFNWCLEFKNCLLIIDN